MVVVAGVQDGIAEREDRRDVEATRGGDRAREGEDDGEDEGGGERNSLLHDGYSSSECAHVCVSISLSPSLYI